MAGLRRNEIDKLQWWAFCWNDGVIRMEETEHFAPKSSDGAGDVPIDKELLAMFRGWHAKATDAFVIEADAEPRNATTYAHYRAQADFDGLTAWLRAKDVTAIKPLHELRKEFGSHTAVWIGSEMIVWGGLSFSGGVHYLDTGGRYNPATNSRISTSNTNTPLGRASHAAIWTDAEMIIWGGTNGQSALNTGGRYCAQSCPTPTATPTASPGPTPRPASTPRPRPAPHPRPTPPG
jgi:hypothetical protein